MKLRIIIALLALVLMLIIFSLTNLSVDKDLSTSPRERMIVLVMGILVFFLYGKKLINRIIYLNDSVDIAGILISWSTIFFLWHVLFKTTAKAVGLLSRHFSEDICVLFLESVHENIFYADNIVVILSLSYFVLSYLFLAKKYGALETNMEFNAIKDEIDIGMYMRCLVRYL